MYGMAKGLITEINEIGEGNILQVLEPMPQDSDPIYLGTTVEPLFFPLCDRTVAKVDPRMTERGSKAGVRPRSIVRQGGFH